MLTSLIKILLLSYAGVFVVNLAVLFLAFGPYVAFLETHISPDGHLASPARTLMLIQIAGMVPIFILWNAEKIMACFRGFTKLPSPIYKLEISIICVFLAIYVISVLFPVTRPIYTEDGPLEGTTALFVLSASVLLLLSARRLTKPLSRAMVILAAGVFFFLGMEEISWGQRIIGWETPDAWMAVNHHGETNLHNNIDPILYLVIFTFNFCVAGFFLLTPKLKKLINDPQITPLLSSHFMYFFASLFMFLAVQSLTRDAEVTEEIVATLVFTRSLSLFLLTKNPARILGNRFSVISNGVNPAPSYATAINFYPVSKAA